MSAAKRLMTSRASLARPANRLPRGFVVALLRRRIRIGRRLLQIVREALVLRSSV